MKNNERCVRQVQEALLKAYPNSVIWTGQVQHGASFQFEIPGEYGGTYPITLQMLNDGRICVLHKVATFKTINQAAVLKEMDAYNSSHCMKLHWNDDKALWAEKELSCLALQDSDVGAHVAKELEVVRYELEMPISILAGSLRCMEITEMSAQIIEAIEGIQAHLKDVLRENTDIDSNWDDT